MSDSRSSHRPLAGFWIGFALVMALLVAAPLVLPEFWRRFVTEILIWGLLAMSSDILIGYTGMVSFGHSAFFGLGMYGAAAALLTVRPPNLWLSLLYGLVAAGLVAAFVAYFSSLTNVRFTATQYALLTSLMAGGRTVMSAGSGWLAEQLGWAAFFAATAGLAIPGLLLLVFLMRLDDPDEPEALQPSSRSLSKG